MGIAQYMGFYTPEQLDGLFEGFARMKVNLADKRAYNNVVFTCGTIRKGIEFPEVSFFKKPFKYLKVSRQKRICDEAIKEVINALKGEDGPEKSLTIYYLNMVKELKSESYIPDAILEEMNKIQVK
ncbi:MAG: hypothetical protein ACP5NZ_00350 [Nanobdellota archaeon]